MNRKIEASLNKVLKAFESGDIVECVTYASIPNPDVPSCKWSMTNRVIAWASGTVDARGFRQWKEVGRSVKKGIRAFHILAPCLKSNDEKEVVVTGFVPVPVFRYEDTEGEALPEFQKIPLPRLAGIASEFGITVNFAGSNNKYWGLYAHGSKAITLCTPDEHVFFHELAHAAHYRVFGDAVRKEKKWKKEVVAELCACAISRMYGKRMDGNSFRYIESYAKKGNKSAYSACMQVLNEVNGVLSEIIKQEAVAA